MKEASREASFFLYLGSDKETMYAPFVTKSPCYVLIFHFPRLV